MLVKARVAENIDILHGGGDFKHYILLGCTIYEILRLLGLVEGMWELVGVADSATTILFPSITPSLHLLRLHSLKIQLVVIHVVNARRLT